MTLTTIEHDGLRVLTTAQLADPFQTSAKVLTRNFQRNNERYEAGVHYFALAGDALKQFKAMRQDDVSLKYVSILYLWTEKGAWLHAKSLNNDSAWQAYRMLIDTYYEMTKQVDQQQLLISHEQIKLIEGRVAALEEALKQVTLHSGEQIRLRNAVGERVSQLAKEKGARSVLFRALYSAIKERYLVGSYRDVKQHELQDALRFISSWK
ncbi:MAG: ORF6N domain-containing protein [Lysinibacillus sp.]